jgi:pilus assembly protein CpaE
MDIRLRSGLKLADGVGKDILLLNRALILGGDEDLQRRVNSLLAEVGHIYEVSSLGHVPGDIEIGRILQIHQPQLVLLVVNSMLTASGFMRRMEINAPGIPVVALSQYTDQRTVRELMLTGIKGFIPIPMAKGHFVEVIGRIMNQLKESGQFEVMRNLFSFLPGKGGSGTSQLACHFASALAADLDSGQRMLLLDLDLSSGLSRYLFERSNAYSLVEMIESGVTLDETYWTQFVARHGNLDVITGGRYNPRHPLTPLQIRGLLDCAWTRYQMICADLTGNSEAFSLEILRRSVRIFLVTSMDPNALQLSRERYQLLDTMGLGRRVGVLLNRFPQHVGIAANRVSNEIGAPVLAEFDFDDRKVLSAMSHGIMFESGTATSRQIRKMAQKLIHEPAFAAIRSYS